MQVIYGLEDPRDNKMHYVGVTDDVFTRFMAHIQCSGNNFAKNAWMLSLRADNVLPRMIELERVEDLKKAHLREAYWIHHYQALGHPLTNICHAGKSKKEITAQELKRLFSPKPEPVPALAHTLEPDELNAKIASLRALGKNQDEIIFLLWGARKGGGPKYQAARARYLQCIEYIENKQKVI